MPYTVPLSSHVLDVDEFSPIKKKYDFCSLILLEKYVISMLVTPNLDIVWFCSRVKSGCISDLQRGDDVIC